MSEKREWLEEDEDGGEPNAKRIREAPPPTFKLLAPKSLASAIQFSSRVIETAAGGTMSITDCQDCYPGTEQQIVTLQAASWDGILDAMRHVLSMVGNCSECVMPGHEEERRLAVVMPSKSVSALIGVKGANVKELQLRAGCHIHVDGVAIGFGPGGDRAVNINGGHGSLEKAVVRAVGCVQEFSDQVWFGRWAARTNAERLEQDQAPPLRGQEVPVRDDGAANAGGWTNGCCAGKGQESPEAAHAMCGSGGMGGMATMMECMGGMGSQDGMDGMGGWTPMMGGMGGMPSMAGMGSMGSMVSIPCMGGMGKMSSAGRMGNMGSMAGTGGMGGMANMNTMGGLPGMVTMGGLGCMAGMGGMGSAGGMGGMGHMGGSAGIGGMDGMGTQEDSMAGPQCMGGKDNFTLSKELVMQVMDDMPSCVTQDPRGFVLRSAVPSRMAGAMQRRSHQVMELTSTKVAFGAEAVSSTRMMSIEGPLFNVCASYMLMMRRYLEVERELC